MAISLPVGWSESTIGELVQFKRGFTWSKAQERDGPGPDLVPVLRIPNIQLRLDLDGLLFLDGVSPEDRVKYRVARGYSLLVGSNGNAQRIGNCVLVEDHMDFIFASFLIAATSAEPSRLAPEYLYRLLASKPIQSAISASVQGSTGLKNISLTLLRSLTVVVPPLLEQRKIAEIMSAVDQVIEKTETVIVNLQTLKKAMMQELLAHGLPGRHTRFRQTPIGEVPEEWETLPFERLLAPTDDALSYGILQPSNDVEDGVPMLRTVDLDEEGSRSGTTLLRVSAEIESAYARTRLRGGEVLLSVMGTVGRTAVVPPEWRGWNVNRALSVIRLSQRVRPDFVSFWLRSPAVQARFEAEQIGSAQKRVNLSDLRKMIVPVPSPREQAGLCDVLCALDHRHASDLRHLAALRAMKSSLLSVLLTGDLRVTPGEGAA